MEVAIGVVTASSAIFFLLQIVASLSSIPPIINSTLSPLCHPTQSFALLQFKNHFHINKSADICDDVALPMLMLNSWREGTDCCLWEGVECDESTGNVISLNLTCLYGQIPTNSSLFQLSHLQKLFLFENDFHESPISSELGRLLNLKHLNISHSNFSGMIPSHISHLSNLISLRIVGDYITLGKGHHLILDSLTFEMLSKNLTNLKDLSLSHVNMSAVNLKSFLNLSASLESLHLYDCLLHGKFPVNVLRFVNLKDFLVWDNPKLTITLPKSNWSVPLETLIFEGTSFSTENFYSLVNLKSLNSLGLINCGLRLIPSCISNLTQITGLDLGDNNVTGEIPTFFSNFKQLKYLYLYYNKFTGSIPSWLFNLSSLTKLDLSNNQLTGEILEFQSKSLVYVSLQTNMLRGPIPVSMFQKSKSLRDLDLSYNNLSMSTLNTVDINWPKLETLYLSSCNITEFPMFLRTQDKLKSLDLSNNNIKGDIPRWMMNVGTETLSYLNISHNRLTGTLQLPWKKLEILDLHSNMLQGPLPIPPPNLHYFFISENNFSGEVSSLYCNMSSLQILDLSYNNLSGTIPSCLGNLIAILSVLNLRRNNFYGTIPTTYSKECALSNLNLEGNQLEGKIPSSLVNCKDLEVLDLGHNMFNDEFPEWLKTLPMLRVLVLRSNKLHGPLPNFAANSSFSKLQVLDLSTNAFVGHLPSLENLQAMANVDESEGASTYLGSELANYDYSVVICVKGNEIEMQKIFHVFTSIDLSNNAFEGEIPFGIGKLLSLKGFNLSHNNLKGHIPPSVGNLKNLEWLDLSSNKLNGEIPTQLVDVTCLSTLNLSNNQLVGHIPEGKQFNTFTIESYKGNLGLCGFPLPRKCGDEELEQPAASIENGKTCLFSRGLGWHSVAIGYGCGMVFGVGMGYIMFRYRRPRWLLLIIEDKLMLKQQRTRRLRRRNAIRNY